ncbi:ubiquinone biosynthesis accessory factor UbiJ [Bordetella holmesii]|uniref:Ubiquinone biosynthesis accessory factor UbiJ n=2 Tax=Bordetella holmesii TaxID=35814 RepID=A0A158M4D1_9BORD|nr:SCP2 sterol-binding domain-containing protein [Bordetella holmesii]AHV92145.1 SCP-2 sterol transfer family protein [Bordetella holmesii ATCC 51541]AIT26538.1 SCP-2 sterol transfer family protein [Bordetella holmesii 44057]EWM43057.1 SCP-2 sterol transfer family protein [Bordetella holmesii 41130]EWM47116.1 SCP-2 sterol transfer family protein [Bordetella holmesii 35009]EWM51280.1 SCP-2 sterol transfer family protein [Bordetella holmesii 70147]
MLPFSVLPTPTRFALRALNTLLDREAWARDRLARHSGKTLRFALGGFGAALTIDSEGHLQQADPAIVPDVTLSAVPERFNLLRFLPGSDKPDLAELTHISGDAALAQVVADLARDLRWDAEDDLARLVGDIPALRLISGAKALVQGARQAADRLAGNAAEYLAEESGVLAGRPALEQWRLDQADLERETDRVARAIAALQGRLAGMAARGAHP